MANYNSMKKYNHSPAKEGFSYNSAKFILTFKLGEVLSFDEDVTLKLASLALSEPLKWKEEFLLEVLHDFKGNLTFESEKAQPIVLMEILDKFEVKEQFVELLVNAMVQDRLDLLEQAKLFSEIAATQELNMIDTPTVEAFIEAIDTTGFEELSKLFVDLIKYDSFNMTDKEPKKAISDFYVTRSEDGIFDVIMPFDLIIDYSKSKIGFMPEAIDSSITISGVDGEMVQDTVYSSRLFDIFAVTFDGLNMGQKAEVKRHLADILNSIKNETKTLTFADREISYDVKYSGLADVVVDAPSWVEFELPLKSAASYGHAQFTKDLKGSGLIDNTGDTEIGATHTITGKCVNPSFTLGDTLVKWNGTVQEGEVLVINTSNYTCKLIGTDGVARNAMKNFNGNFPRIPVGSIVLHANSGTEDYLKTAWQELFVY